MCVSRLTFEPLLKTIITRAPSGGFHDAVMTYCNTGHSLYDAVDFL